MKPFKVICIDDIKQIPDTRIVPGPIFLDIDCVTGEGFEKELGKYYTLERFGQNIGYSQIHFIPVSEIDEKEFERNYKKELV